MSTEVAVLDADVLVPILSCDLLLSAFDEDLYRPRVAATILDEIERNLLGGFTRLDPVTLRGRVAQVAAVLSHHCRIGERSAHTWFVLHELLGYADVRNYDGSWTEYGSLVGVPVER